MARLLLLVLLLMSLPAPAHADDISASARGVVRVVTIAVVDEKVVDFGHGSGFAVAPNRVVTNAHVVELAARYPDNVVVGIVPSEGDKSYEGKVIALDAARDLALIEFKGVNLSTLALYTGPVDEGGSVTALGYPGNVDIATARSAADYIRPLSPVRSEGVFSGRRMLTDIQVLLHTASIARGNSGGPLLDPCGRVVGVNSALTKSEEGDSSFGFAIADTELMAFLRAAKQPYAAVGVPCTSIADRLRQDSDADARAVADAQSAKLDAAGKAAAAREQALIKARAEAARSSENYMAIAAVLLVLGALLIGGAGMLELRGERRGAIWAASGGGVLLVAAVIIFLVRPSGEVTLPDAVATAEPVAVNSDAAIGKLVCTVVPERSRVTVSSTEDVKLDWGDGGCMNGRTQYAENGSRWDRILVPAEEQTVSILQFDPATRVYSNTRYLLSAGQMDAARKVRSQVTVKACSPDIGARANLSSQQAAIRAALPPYPNEKIVYSCKSGE
ncbi:trypsin-like peptidase domain-containing protein [Sphingomonas sp. So64.6b]|uniref:S1C family serine protease n=1 Tax=Sphingomonas sp. So64.6b TaxID=2997354 RepID=UPI0016012477|nr:serine protease [Sphingomonas sp. So64.6b]QNA84569.1 trypsin-like peptidase domain-containing protein [Sphingomonas sp. So64.6b]